MPYAEPNADTQAFQAPLHDPHLDDKALAEAVRRALRKDAATRALAIEVEVWDGVVHLRGVVAEPGDVEAAEAIAGRVPGVATLADDLEIRASAPQPR